MLYLAMEHKLTKGEITIHKIKGIHKWTKPQTGIISGSPYLESHCEICGKKATEEDIIDMGRQDPFFWRNYGGSTITFSGTMGVTTASGVDLFMTTYS